MSDRVQGTMRNVGGRAQEAVGDALGDSQMSARGVYNQAAGTAEDTLGQLSDAIVEKPITSALVCIGIGYLLGKIL